MQVGYVLTLLPELDLAQILSHVGIVDAERLRRDLRDVAAYCFSPVEAERHRRSEWRRCLVLFLWSTMLAGWSHALSGMPTRGAHEVVSGGVVT